MNILISMPKGDTQKTFFTKEVCLELETLGNITWNNTERQFTKDEFREVLIDKDICITGWGCPKLDDYVIEKANKLKVLAHTGGSVAYIASEALFDKGIKVLSGNNIYAESVAEGVMAYILCSLRELIYYNNEVKEGRWREDIFFNESLLDKKVGLVGFGAIAKYLVKMLQPFRCKIKVYDPFLSEETLKEYGVQKATLEEIFQSCKIISLHASYRSETHHMINKNLLSMIQKDGLLINTARGGIIDEEALVEELEKNRFKAVLDVYEVEPLPLDSKLRTLQNVISIPHMGGPTMDRRSYVTQELINNIKSYMSGGEAPLEITKAYGLSMTNE